MWKKLNGKKTVVSVLLYVATLGLALATGQSLENIAAPETWQDFLTLALGSAATVLGGAGITHKIAKGELSK